MTDITIPPEALEAAARAIIIANGGDPDALLRLTIHKTTIKAWQQVAPLARAALAAGLAAWPGMEHLAKATIRISGADVDIPERINLPVGETR